MTEDIREDHSDISSDDASSDDEQCLIKKNKKQFSLMSASQFTKKSKNDYSFLATPKTTLSPTTRSKDDKRLKSVLELQDEEDQDQKSNDSDSRDEIMGRYEDPIVKTFQDENLLIN